MSLSSVIFLGSDLKSLKTSTAYSLCRKIIVSPIHWSKATDFPKSVTHAVDFGPGGLGGIGPLTARSLDGRVSELSLLAIVARGRGIV